MPKVTEKTKPDIPSLSDAEKWLSPFVFVYRGKSWYEKPNGEVVEIGGVDDDNAK